MPPGAISICSSTLPDLLDIIDAAAELEDLLEVPVDIVTSRSLRTGHEIATSAVPV
ncbi:hypothetical protein [Arsenicicoccus bolidensis]|uniref:hypothetical protein n=1 Tax=Arsenicicoccus bolidensis TaxID=229480 RepID=UPI0028ACDDF5|nr:hypothetical protein [Arsenicicoccus bolidensis]